MSLYNEISLISSSRNNLILLKLNRSCVENHQGHIGSRFWMGSEPMLSFKLRNKNQHLGQSKHSSLLPPWRGTKFQALLICISLPKIYTGLDWVMCHHGRRTSAIFLSPPDCIQWGKSNFSKINCWVLLGRGNWCQSAKLNHNFFPEEILLNCHLLNPSSPLPHQCSNKLKDFFYSLLVSLTLLDVNPHTWRKENEIMQTWQGEILSPAPEAQWGAESGTGSPGAEGNCPTLPMCLLALEGQLRNLNTLERLCVVLGPVRVQSLFRGRKMPHPWLLSAATCP